MRVLELDRRVDPLRLVSHPDLAQAALVAVRGWSVIVGEPLERLEGLASLDRLDELLGPLAPITAGPPFGAGATGWIADDASPALLALPTPRRPPASATGIRFGVHDSAVCVDEHGRAFVTGADLAITRDDWPARVRRWRALVASCPPAAPAPQPQRREVRLSLDAPEHAACVRQARQWIAAGDLYQLNLTLQLAVDWPHGGPVLARALWAASPGAAHACWLREPDLEVVSVSPETFLRVDGRSVVTRPIKGTRPRRDDPSQDEEQAAALTRSAKDSAEHVMIVDLARNDLGRVCETGSVHVPELAALEAHPTVWHLTSTVRGRLRPDVSTRELIGATFPPGSVTGAPKRMAWSRIADLEPVDRGVYCGAIGVIGPQMIDLSVAIRTAVLADGVASYGAGGGIVADSEEDAEFVEAMDKARAFAAATGATLGTR